MALSDDAPASGQVSSAAPRGRRQRLAAYAIIRRESRLLLTRLAPRISVQPRWTLPGGGVEFGEHPRDAVVREVFEETGLQAHVGETARTQSGVGAVGDGRTDQHSVRMVFEGWVGVDAPAPQVQEVDGSTAEARWVSLAEIEGGEVALVSWVREILLEDRPTPKQRLSAYVLTRRAGPRGPQVLLVRMAGSDRYAGGRWTLPGGGVEHGESPRDAVRREVAEETGLDATVGGLLEVHDRHFVGTAPNGRQEDFHGVYLVFAGEVPQGQVPRPDPGDDVTEARWVDEDEVRAGRLDTLSVVAMALEHRPDHP